MSMLGILGGWPFCTASSLSSDGLSAFSSVDIDLLLSLPLARLILIGANEETHG